MNYRRLYLDNSLVFITIVTNCRKQILIDYIDILKKSYNSVSDLYNFKVIAYCILPDHIHCIIKPNNYFEYSKIVKSFKYSFSKNVGLVNPTYKKLWQNRYWEHTIRDEKDFHIHLDYIHYNPVKHNLVKNVNKWEYSSFKDYVENGYYNNDWCNFEDRNRINELNYE